MEDAVLEVLERIKPMLKLHKGGVELVGVDGKTGVVSVRMLGTCVGCPLSELTLKGGIEAMLIENVPGVTEVVAVK